MRKLVSVILALVMVMSLAVGVVAAEEPEMYCYGGAMTYYVGGYGAIPSRCECAISFGGDGSNNWSESFYISYGDSVIPEWPTEVGEYTVYFEKTFTVEGQEYTFEFPMYITVLDMSNTSGQCGDNMTWKFDPKTYTLTISGTGDMYTVVDGLEWEDEILWRPEWWNNDSVKHIVIEEGVERLTNFAFRHNFYVESIQLPSTLKELPDLGVFASRQVIAQLIIPEGITSITGWPFGSPGNTMMHVKELYLPSTLTKMDLMSLALACVQVDGDNFSFDELTVHYAGTQEQWEAIERVKSDFFVEQGLEDFYNNFAEWCTSFEAAVVFEPKQEDEDITVDNGNATIPDSKVEITEGKDIVIDVTTTETEETITGAVIGSETVDKIVDAGTTVEIKLPDATVSFDATAMGTIAGAATDKPITIVAKETEQSTLTAEQKATLEKYDVSAVLSLEVLAGDTKISDFGGGKVTVTVPFELPEGKSGDDFYVAYIAADGTMTVMPTTYSEGAITFTTTHFSDYVVLEKTVSDNPATGDTSNIMLLVVVMVISAGALVFCATKRRAY